jgi:CDP-ribitol ribitolphosphotransferase
VTTVTAVAWERIQIVLSLAPDPGSGPGAAQPVSPGMEAHARGHEAVRLVHDDGPVLEASWTEPGSAAVRVWFDVMCGPGQMPLAPGRWRLVEGPATAPRPVHLASGVVLADDASRRFTIPSGRFDVTTTVDPATRALTFETARILRADQVAGRRLPPAIRRRVRPVVRSVRGLPERLCVAVARRTVRRGSRRRVLFAGGTARELSGNLRAVQDRMVERGLDRDLELVTSHGIRRPRRPGHMGRPTLRAMWRLTRLVDSADVILVTGSLHEWAGVVRPAPRTRYIQLWHAIGAFKTVGYSRVGMPDAIDPYGPKHKDYTHVIVSSEAMRRFYAEAFSVPVERVVATGIPRADRFFDPVRRAADLAAVRARFPAAEGRRVILFAPTYRGSAARARYDQSQLDFAAFHDLAVERDAVIIFKLHPFVHEPLAIPEALRDRLIDATRLGIEANDLLLMTDVLVSDYSTIIYEFSTLGRPILFFAYDLDEYIGSRGFYEPFESFVPGPILRTFDELLAALRSDAFDAERVAAFAARNFDHLDAGATDRIIDQLILAP